MSPVEAAAKLREQINSDPDAKRTVMAIVAGDGFDDLYDWCDEHPDKASRIAEAFDDMDVQLREMKAHDRRTFGIGQ